MAENDSWFSSLISGAVELGKGTADVVNSFKGGDESAEETAYLRGQVDALNAAAEAKTDSETIRIGDLEISTSSILWIVGGTVGILAMAMMLKNVVK